MSVATVLLMVLAAFAAVPGTATTKTEDRYVVLFEGDIDMALVKNSGGQLIKSQSGMGMVVAKMDSDEAKALKKSSKVTSVEMDQKATATAPPFPPPGKNKDDPDPEPEPEVELQWGVDRIDAEAVWDTTTGTGIIVAILDTGVDPDHTELTVLDGKSYVEGVYSPDDDNGHGTNCAGIVAAQWNFAFDAEDQSGVVGVAPGVEILPVKVLDSGGSGWYSDIVLGIDWAVDNGADVISMSLSGSSSTDALKTACDSAYSSGVLVIAAAGNSGKKKDTFDNVQYPARYSSVIAVGATDSSDNRARFSATGPALELMAPGVSIKSTWLNDGYKTISGTSMACPHVAGVAALVLTISVPLGYDTISNGQWDPVEVRAFLADTATDLGKANAYGNGLVDAELAIEDSTDGDD